MLRYAPDNQPGNTGYRPTDPIVPGVTYGGSPGAWANGMYGGYRGGGGFMGNYITPRQPITQPPPQEDFNLSPFQDSGIGDFLRRLRGYGQRQQFQPVNLFQPAAGINLQGAFGGGT